MSTAEFLAFLKKRQGLLDGVCVSGGEPTLQPELPRFLEDIKALGYAVKLDTNGTRPQVIKDLVSRKLVDYIAMDVKNSPEGYGQTTGVETIKIADIEESLRFLISGEVDYELRSTLVEPLHTAESIRQMGQWLASLVPGKLPKQLFLQSFVDRDTVLFAGLSAPAPETVDIYAKMLSGCAQKITIRNK